MHPTESAFLADILAKPDDDLPRLVFADWLDERDGPGDRERSEFIRVQVELAKIDAGLTRFDKESGPAITLRRREFVLFNEHCDRWFPHPGLWGVSWGARLDAFDPTPEQSAWKVRRGFVSEVRCTLADWCGQLEVVDATTLRGPASRVNMLHTTGIGPAVVRSHPVTSVVLVDREPLEISDGTCEWHRGSGAPHYIPNEIYSLINAADGVIGKAAAGREAATSALSAALVAWANSQPLHARISATPVSVDITAG